MKATILFFFVILLVASCKEKINSMQDMMNAMAPEQQRSTIDPTVDNVIKGEKGTQVFIPANALRFKDGTVPTDKVNIALKEFFSISEFISNSLSTMSDSFLLETNGMLYISATADGKELVVDISKSYTITFPKTDSPRNMQLFYGDNSSAGTINWQPALPIGEGFTVGYDSLLVDTTLYKKEISICSYVSAVNNDPLLWRINHQDSTIFEYFLKNFKTTDTTFLNNLCERGEIPGMRLEIDTKGKVTNVEFDRKDQIFNGTPASLRKQLSEIFLALPNFNMETMAAGQEAYLQLGLCCHTKFDQDSYKKRFDMKYTKYRNQAIEKMDKGELELYVFSATKFGWINCDRFYYDEREQIDFIVKSSSADSKIFIVFDSINSIMAGNLANGNFIFPNVPVGSKVKVIAINFENGKPGMAVQPSIISKDAMNISNFKSFTISELEKQLNKS